MENFNFLCSDIFHYHFETDEKQFDQDENPRDNL